LQWLGEYLREMRWKKGCPCGGGLFFSAPGTGKGWREPFCAAVFSLYLLRAQKKKGKNGI
jgi:hypothetical protein